MCNLPPQIKKVTKVKEWVAGEFLLEGPERARSPERQLHEAMKVILELHLRLSESCAIWQKELHTNGIRKYVVVSKGWL